MHELLSILNSCAKQLQIIIVDDGSEPIHANANRRSSTSIGGIYIYNKLSVGGSQARNIGLQQATGNLVWFIDDDDLPSLQSIKDVMEIAEKPSAAMYILPFILERNGVFSSTFKPRSEENNYRVYRDRGQRMNTSCVAFSRSALSCVAGWDESLPAGQDTDLILRVSELGTPVCVQTAPVIIRTGHPVRITSSAAKQQKAKLMMLRKHYDRFTWRRRLYYLVTYMGAVPYLKLYWNRVRNWMGHNDGFR